MPALGDRVAGSPVGGAAAAACASDCRVVQTLGSGPRQGAIGGCHIDHCLDEFNFRLNRRKSHSLGKLFYRLVLMGGLKS